MYGMLEQLETPADSVVIKGVRVLDVRDGTLGDETDVLISGHVIRDIDCSGQPAGADSIDGNGCTLIPGLINCHAHILSPFLSEQKGIPGAWSIKQAKRNMEATE